MRRGRFERYH